MSRPRVLSANKVVPLVLLQEDVEWLKARSSEQLTTYSASARELFAAARRLEAEGLWAWLDELSVEFLGDYADGARAAMLMSVLQAARRLKKTKPKIFDKLIK